MLLVVVDVMEITTIATKTVEKQTIAAATETTIEIHTPVPLLLLFHHHRLRLGRPISPFTTRSKHQQHHRKTTKMSTTRHYATTTLPTTLLLRLDVMPLPCKHRHVAVDFLYRARV
jgi:hypothetical protein